VTVTSWDPKQLQPGLYTIAQAAARLGVVERTAHKWVQRGVFPVPVLKVGGTLRVRVNQLEAFVLGEGEGQS
jgi:excisionase family DNA binding protein